jgi:hypothetical protein
VVDPGGRTFARLAAPGLGWIVGAPAVRTQMDADLRLRDTYDVLRSVIGGSRQSRVATRPGEASSSLSIIDAAAFLKLYDLQFGRLAALQRAGLTKLIDYINHDPDIWDIGWCAYMLATVKRECRDQWQPIPEIGRGAGHAYGRPAPHTDAQGKRYANIYYGRGYVQLTWLSNYITPGQALGLGDDLAKNPDAAVWREIGSEEAQPQAAFLEALSAIVGRWLLVRSNAPEIDLVTVVCRSRAYIGRRGAPKTGDSEWKA